MHGASTPSGLWWSQSLKRSGLISTNYDIGGHNVMPDLCRLFQKVTIVKYISRSLKLHIKQYFLFFLFI